MLIITAVAIILYLIISTTIFIMIDKNRGNSRNTEAYTGEEEI